jgi:hypothetical protein
MRLKLTAAVVLGLGMMAVVQAQPGGRGFFGGPAGLVTNKAVQEELKLTEDQVSKVNEWAKGFREKANEIRKDKGVEFKKGGFGKGGEISAEMQEKMAAANAEINKVAYKDLGDVLKKDQIERLKQIDHQVMGVNAFTDPTVAESLKLTDSQKTSIKGISSEFQKESRELRQEAFGKGGKGGGFDPEKFGDFQKKSQKLQKEFVAKAIDVLDADQKKTWKSLIGEPFDTSKLMQGFGNRKKD